MKTLEVFYERLNRWFFDIESTKPVIQRFPPVDVSGANETVGRG